MRGTSRPLRIPALVTAVVVALTGAVRADVPRLPLWPYPHDTTMGYATCDLYGKDVCIPAKAGEKAAAIAQALAERLAQDLSLPAAPKIRREGASAASSYALSLGRGPESWAQAGAGGLFDEVPPTLRSQAYCLDVAPEGAVIVSPGSWGLWYGAVTLMQLARNAAEGTKIPCVTIRDWPDLEARAGHVTRPPVEHRNLAGLYAQDGKVNMLVWENFMVGFAGDSHPELGDQRGTFTAPVPAYGGAIRQVRCLGVEVVPLRWAARVLANFFSIWTPEASARWTQSVKRRSAVGRFG